MKTLHLVLALAAMGLAADASWQLSKARQSMEDGRPDRAWDRYLKAEDLAARQGDRSTWIAARCQRVELLLVSEDIAGADSLKPALSLLGETVEDSARIRLTLARVLLARNQPAPAQAEAWAARQSARSADQRELEAACWLALARSEHLGGKTAEAKESLEEARSRAAGQPHLISQAWLEEARQKRGAPEKALPLVRKAREGFQAARWPSGQLPCLELEAQLLESLGQQEAARQAWQRMAELAQRLGLERAQERAQARLK